MRPRLTLLALLAYLLLASCARPPAPPVASAELQHAFQGPLCTRLNGVAWPCNDTDGRLWNQWYRQQEDHRHQQVMHAIASERTAESIKAFVLGAARGFGDGLGGRGYGHYHYHGTITTRCSYGTYRSSCTTRY